MLDFIKRLFIALAIGTCIGIMFIGTSTASAEEKAISPIHIWPTVGEITDTFGTRGGTHHGIDIAAPVGTPVISIADGMVRKSYYSDSYGHVIFVEHDHGLETVYAHLNERFVEEGDTVKEGEQIGTVGNTGRSSGPHLHFEVHKDEWNVEKSNAIDPFLVLADERDYMYAAVDDSWKDGKEEESTYAFKNKFTNEDEDELEEIELLENQQVFTVSKGDTLWGIAQKHEMSVETLMEINGLNDTLIHPGDDLIVLLDDEESHVVKTGDTLYRIALNHQLTVEELQANNDLTDELIFPGQVLALK
ncbi:peptidoglycan DD-metalloendopeptidase family protein [Halalkalibacterium halodurans]|uniref:BH1600 protein n=1 Tax=Halalkalibacterium halodurans (strain ATCC BAA-125 / DSM 18197 / FERM 7344 / JCM 9153 / C-125) TaxID=272558 RepID=Q9KCH1_HALH5|nr:M23 family metallopeptidase [Halalkalibacterium halodurans]MED4081827.1 peptidoglycan DD-metalloendopeptidase family protein [Halalkalibacterium halodurans]MED4086436.1 peptidoglycan DD-metalloendopeptidase family protein [Halalkalibacterium halodurans]MED4105028.1 peptidoglycan DD-metalloendopeptidase family protein [Halalkalibacterium halodurans]MED4110792.1 peptidoglycan DD-metalloendopeptidase family protein [Halalkalibacterium halodurans]MED4125749.1 peptidoglycan DD-metalloendopeptida